MQDAEIYSPGSQAEWRKWLIRNHQSSPSVWLVLYKKKSEKHNLPWAAAVEEALCFGWIDGRRKPVDDEKFIQFFCKRKAMSTWSKVNKAKVTDLIERKQMMPAGLEAIHTAKQNGSWTVLDEVEDLLLPPDLQSALEQQPDTLKYYSGLSNSVKKTILQWVKLCKTDKTRQKRITEIVNSAQFKTLPVALKR